MCVCVCVRWALDSTYDGAWSVFVADETKQNPKKRRNEEIDIIIAMASAINANNSNSIKLSSFHHPHQLCKLHWNNATYNIRAILNCNDQHLTRFDDSNSNCHESVNEESTGDAYAIYQSRMNNPIKIIYFTIMTTNQQPLSHWADLKMSFSPKENVILPGELLAPFFFSTKALMTYYICRLKWYFSANELMNQLIPHWTQTKRWKSAHRLNTDIGRSSLWLNTDDEDE